MERQTRNKFNTQIYEEACEWFIECRSGDLDDASRGAFDRWLRKSPEHLSAYLEVAAIWNEGPSLDSENRWDLDTLIAQAAEDRDNIVSLPKLAPVDVATQVEARPKTQSTNRGTRGVASRWRLRALAACLVVGVGVTAGIWFADLRSTYSTVTGEQRSLVLADGSTVELNSRSKIRVHYSEHERDVDLIEGQALFHVAKDSSRPFIVRSDETRVRAVGTEFDVYRKSSGTVVTVVEGRIAVLSEATLSGSGPTSPPQADTPLSPQSASLSGSAGGQGAGIVLIAGEQLTVTHKTAQKAAHPNIAAATAWTQRQLVFESSSLADIAEEFNRYNDRKLIIDDPSLDDFHISGVFSSTDPASLIRFLRERPGLQIEETNSEIRIARKNS